ncbi:MAG: hypothetical protein HN945_03140 [Deltaproteobacteria bacterium]|nr:hypothetical protein [Deltaproteobacteria bacterium]MBT4640607.1 hypothetical protein [Deltaproteobacteria bacterium]MBT6615286.1 hypothetical protein [Deltaproteobacteria bacterium]MBT7151429.1 hypothetical protein [Deltaproteobacteria bacterium]MBT7714136.1 hypothetical protein [Deltaproteobacteria bacterium]
MDIVMLEDQISQAYTGNGLTDIYTQFFKDFLEKCPSFFKNHGLDRQEFFRILVPKKQLVRLLAAVFLEPAVLSHWIETLSATSYKALAIVVWEGVQNVDNLEKQIGCLILMPGANSGKGKQKAVRNEFCLFQSHYFDSFWGAEGSVYTLDLPEAIRQLLKPVLPVPSGLILTGSPSMPGSHFRFEDEGRILKALPTICSFMQQGRLDLTQQGEPRTKSIIRLREICGLNEFYEQQLWAELSYLRTQMLVHLLRLVGVDEVPSDTALFLKTVFEQYLKIQKYPHLPFLSHIKGLHHSRDAINHRLHRTCWDLLGSLPGDQWITVEQISGFARLHQKGLDPVLKKSADRYLYITEEWQGWGNKKMYITPGRYEHALAIPLLKASLLLYASFGLVDLAYNSPKNQLLTSVGKPYLTVFDGLVAVRLTKLGAYITGRKSSFAYSQPTDGEIVFELDEERLFISYSRPDSLTALTLDKFASQIGLTRYKVDFTSFLKGCRNRVEVIEKIQVFKNEIGDCLPPLWQIFFEEVVTRVGVLPPIDDVVVYRISSRNQELIDTFARDKTLGLYILKAEGQHIIIRSEDVVHLKNRLEELGYLM